MICPKCGYKKANYSSTPDATIIYSCKRCEIKRRYPKR